MQLLLKEPGTYASVISHLVSYRAAPRMVENLLAAEPQNVAGVPCVKVIIDFTTEAEELEVFEPHRLFSEDAQSIGDLR